MSDNNSIIIHTRNNGKLYDQNNCDVTQKILFQEQKETYTPPTYTYYDELTIPDTNTWQIVMNTNTSTTSNYTTSGTFFYTTEPSTAAYTYTQNWGQLKNSNEVTISSINLV